MIDVPETHRHKPERGRLHATGRATDDGNHSTLLVVHEMDGSWTIHGLGAPGITLSTADMVTLAESILERARWVTEPHCLHLLEAHSAELLAECHRAGLYLALCGEELAAGELPHAECEPAGCERETVYCLACIREANRHNYELGCTSAVHLGGDGAGPVEWRAPVLR